MKRFQACPSFAIAPYVPEVVTAPYLQRAYDRMHLSIRVEALDTLSTDGLFELKTGGRRLLACDAEAAQLAYNFFLSLHEGAGLCLQERRSPGSPQ